MAVRMSLTTTQKLTRTATLPDATTYSVCGWFYQISSTNGVWGGQLFSFDSNLYLDTLAIRNPDSPSGHTFFFFNDATVTAAGTTSLSTATWYFFGIARDSTSIIVYLLNGTTWTTEMTLTSPVAHTPDTVEIGADNATIGGDTSIDGRYAYYKIWSGAKLTLTEFQQEALAIRPIRFANLFAFYPMFPGTGERGRDYSGNGANLTENGSLTDEDQPPVSYGAPNVINFSAFSANYSRGNYASLPTADADLVTIYTDQNVTDVATSNDVRVAQLTSGTYAIHQYKNAVTGMNSVYLNWEGQTDYAPTSSTVYLQIYNRNSTTWETVASNNSTAASTDFNLTGTIATMTNYINSSSVICCRIYQQNRS